MGASKFDCDALCVGDVATLQFGCTCVNCTIMNHTYTGKIVDLARKGGYILPSEAVDPGDRLTFAPYHYAYEVRNGDLFDNNDKKLEILSVEKAGGRKMVERYLQQYESGVEFALRREMKILDEIAKEPPDIISEEDLYKEDVWLARALAADPRLVSVTVIISAACRIRKVKLTNREVNFLGVLLSKFYNKGEEFEQSKWQKRIPPEHIEAVINGTMKWPPVSVLDTKK